MISARNTGRDSLLFVYGTLRAFVDVPIAAWLRRTAHHVGPATTRGRLYDLGAYPGMRAARGRSDIVVGEVYRVRSPRVFRVLDAYEAGSARGRPQFVRRRCRVKQPRCVRVAWAYFYCRRVAYTKRISGGDYRVHCAARRFQGGLC